MVVVFGGVGSLWGTLTAGTSLGVVSKLLEPGVGAVLAKILVLVFLIVFIQRRPRGSSRRKAERPRAERNPCKHQPLQAPLRSLARRSWAN